jgi:hypothetical protein
MLTFFFTMKLQANAGPQRLTQACKGQHRPAKANDGHHKLLQACRGQQQPTTANAGQQKPPQAHASHHRRIKGAGMAQTLCTIVWAHGMFFFITFSIFSLLMF